MKVLCIGKLENGLYVIFENKIAESTINPNQIVEDGITTNNYIGNHVDKFFGDDSEIPKRKCD